MRSNVVVPVSALVAASLAACGPTPTAAPEPRVTWHRDIAPLVQANCAGCHGPGGLSGLPLDGYEDAKAMARSMAAAVESRRMPPWMPDESCQPLSDSRSLTAEEIALFTAWAAEDAPEGDPADAPPAAAAPPGLPQIDAVLTPAVDYVPSSEVTDDYRCLVLDPQNGGDRQITGFEVIGGATELLHHVLLYKATRSEVQSLDDMYEGPGWPCFGGPRTKVALAVGAWAPGTPPTVYPGGTGVPLWQDEVLVMQIHYNMSSAPPRPDRTTLRLMYADRPVASALLFPVVENDFSIPPGAVGYSTTGTQELPVDARVWGLFPHMHTLGRKIRVEADGMCLVDIPSWNFEWQQFYFFAQKGGLPLKAGSNLKVTCTWDNPGSEAVTWGEGTSEEMCLAFFYATP